MTEPFLELWTVGCLREAKNVGRLWRHRKRQKNVDSLFLHGFFFCVVQKEKTQSFLPILKNQFLWYRCFEWCWALIQVNLWSISGRRGDPPHISNSGFKMGSYVHTTCRCQNSESWASERIFIWSARWESLARRHCQLWRWRVNSASTILLWSCRTGWNWQPMFQSRLQNRAFDMWVFWDDLNFKCVDDKQPVQSVVRPIHFPWTLTSLVGDAVAHLLGSWSGAAEFVNFVQRSGPLFLVGCAAWCLNSETFCLWAQSNMI